MKIDFSQKRLDKYRSYSLVWSMATSHKFYQIFGRNRMSRILRKLGKSIKIPKSNISGTVEASNGDATGCA